MSEARLPPQLEATDEALSFRCTSCGACCRSLRVALTSFDLARLVAATRQSPAELVAWLATDEVDMTGEPQSFVELREGRRLMVLAQTDGACRLLQADNQCGAYAARPRDCRAFPFDIEDAETSGAPVRRLRLLPLNGCDFARDGQQDAPTLQAEDEARWRELQQYQALLARWNRQMWHRRRLHRALGTAADFLAFALRP